MATRVSTHICAGNVSPAGDALVAVGVVSIHICVGNVSAIRLDVVFQFIYVRGMFRRCISMPQRPDCFNSYMCGECFIRAASYVQALFWFQLIYARGMFCHHRG